MTESAPSWERVHKALVQRLIQLGDNDLARVLLDSEFQVNYSSHDFNTDYYSIRILVPPPDYDGVKDKGNWIKNIVNEVLTVEEVVCDGVTMCLPLPELEEDWRENLRAIIRGDKVTNQGSLVTLAPYEFRGLYFRSKTEIKIAEALDRAKVLYFPLPVACWNGRNKEPDFLVRCPSGKWGILEVQGERFHSPARADQDHERSRGFMRLGVNVQFYSSERCYNDPDGVVKDFIKTVSVL